MTPDSPDDPEIDPDRPHPGDGAPPLRARVPDHIAEGVFSTGAVVMSGAHEFIIDFLQTIGRPHRVAARIVIPGPVLPQFIEALSKNLELYRGRFGEPGNQKVSRGETIVTTDASGTLAQTDFDDDPGGGEGSGGSSAGLSSQTSTPQSPPSPRRPSPQEIYDDLKLPDTILSGCYANGVMIGHGATEFGLDFLTSFFPQSAVSARVFLAAGQVPRLLESLKGAWNQAQNRRRPPEEF